MQQRQRYPIEDLIDFLDPTFPGRRSYRTGFGRSVAIPWEPEAIRAIQNELRSYLKEWIDSGFQADGSEKPHPWRSPKSGHALSLQNRP
jgi:hypothetical protein